MIISHKHRFIFIKTTKTAGTSIEIALSAICGPGDVITPLDPEDQAIRATLGIRGPQNLEIPWSAYTLGDVAALLRTKQRPRFHGHVSAAFIRKRVPAVVWRTYFKFCFERNPFDKAISRYFWGTKHLANRPDIPEYLETERRERLSNWSLYTIDDQVAVDFVGRFEHLDQDFALVLEKLGISDGLGLPWRKGNYRTDKRHYREILDERSRMLIEHICNKELSHFGYRW
jgi:hypothetical protein